MYLSNHKGLFVGTSALLGLMFMSQGADAVTTTNLTVNSTVVQACNVTANTLTFGTYVDGQANAKDEDTTVTYDCAANLDITLNLSLGGNGNTGTNQRFMSNAGVFLEYELFQEFGRTTFWGTGVDGLDIIATPGGAQNVSVYGRIPGGQGVGAGSFSDTVVYSLTVN